MSGLAKLVGASIAGCAVMAFAAVQHRENRQRTPAPQPSAAVAQAAARPPAAAAPQSAAGQASMGNTAILYADMRGHFVADVQVRGIPIRALVDTGATLVSFSAEDAAKFGLREEPGQRKAQFSTANGIVMASLVRVPEIRLQGITVYDVEAALMPAGAMQGTLLGMSFMKKLEGYESRGASMVLRK